jgi:heat shock protein HslJ
MRRFPLLLVIVVAIAGGCSLRGDDNANGGLVNSAWTVLSIAGAPTVGAIRPTMTFAQDATVSGSSGCNQYSAPFRTDGGAFSVGSMTSTLMNCAGAPDGAQEAAFLSALQGATTWSQAENGNLVLSGAGEIVAGPGVAEGPPDRPSGEPGADLADTAWVLLEMGGTADFAHLVPTLAFGSDGTLSGFGGCNDFSAPYTVSGGDLTIGALATTKRACIRPGSVVESTYLEGLVGATTWSIDDKGLLQVGGAVPLTLAPG